MRSLGGEASLADALRQANERAPLTVAVANAGVGGAVPILGLVVEDFENVLRTNLIGAMLTFKQAGRLWQPTVAGPCDRC